MKIFRKYKLKSLSTKTIFLSLMMLMLSIVLPACANSPDDNMSVKEENAVEEKMTDSEGVVGGETKVNDEINYDELCGRDIKNSIYYIKQALQTIDFELNNVGGSVKSEAVIEATMKAGLNISRKMIFDSDFILYLKESNKEQPYFALKVDNIDVLISE